MTNTNIKNVLDNDYVMVYLGVGSGWGSSSTVAALNTGNTTTAKVYTTTSRGSSSAEPYYFWHEITTAIPKGSSGTYYLTNNKGNWAGQSITAALKAGGAYWMNGDWSGYTTKYSSNIFHTTSPTASIPTTASSVTQGSTISVTTTLTKGYKNLPYSAVYSKMNLKFYAKDSSDKFWEVGTNTSLTTATSVSTTLSGVAELSAGTYTIYAALYDSYGVYIKATNTFTLTVTAPSVPTVSFGTTSSTINWGDKVNITVTTANIADGSTITFKAGGSSIGTASVSSNSATLSNYQPTAFAASTTITAEYSSTTSTNSYTLSMRTPAVSLSVSPTSAGTGDNVTFTATKSNVSSNATVTYKFDDTTSGTTTIQAASSTATCTTSWAASGSKTVKVTMTVTFSGSSKTATATKSITISPKTTIYFDNSVTNWSNVYLYLYSSNYWDESNGTGGQTSKGRYDSQYTMTKVAGTDNIYSYTYLGTVPSYVCFINSTGMDDYEYFWNGTAGVVRAVYKSFSASTPLYIPSSTYTPLNDGGKVYYYNGGEWSVYPPASYTLTVASANTSQGTITTPSGGSYTDVAKNASKSIAASAKSGYVFKNWTASPAANATIASSTSASTTVTVKGDVTLTANFEAAYTLTVNVSPAAAGSITSPSGGSATVGASQTTALKASKNNGYTFVNWTKESGSGTISNATSMNGNASITSISSNTAVQANFTQDEYTVTVVADGGTISVPSTGSYSGVHYGDIKNITALSSGYSFTGWTASPAENATFANSNNMQTTATIKGNVEITANFRLPITMYFSNEDCADNVYIHIWSVSDGSISSSYPGIKMARDENGWYYYQAPTGVTGFSYLINAGGDDTKTSDKSISNASGNYYFKYSSSNKTLTSTTSDYAPETCIPDVYTIVGSSAWLGSNFDTNDGANEMIYNSSSNRYELLKANVTLSQGTYYYKAVKNHCYTGANCGQWPNNGSNLNYYFNSADNYDMLFYLDLNTNTCGVEVSAAATIQIRHKWADEGWATKDMSHSTGSLYVASGQWGEEGADIIINGSSTWIQKTSISGYSTPTSGDIVTFTYDKSSGTLSVVCPNCDSKVTYWIRHGWNGSWNGDADWKKMTALDDGTYTLTGVKWGNTISDVNTTKQYNVNQITANNTINHANFSVGDLVTFIYDPDINQLTIVDANIPQITLTATQTVNEAATQAVVTLTTTNTKTITNPTYTYKLVSGPSLGTWGENPTNTTTFTTTEEGTYQFSVSVNCDEGTFTATCTVKVKFKIIVYAYVGNPNWDSPININYWAAGVTAANHAMTNVGGSWYKYEVKGVPEFTFFVRQATGTGSNQTDNIGPIDDDICIVVKTDLEDSKRTHYETTDCELYMRFSSTYDAYKGDINLSISKTVYSNLFKANGDAVSFYVGSTPNVKHQTFNSTTNKWNTGTTINGLTGGDVYAGYYDSSAATKLNNWKRYTDDFYVRTDVASGGWENYIRSDQAMFEFSRNAFYENEWYNHYWCKWIGSGSNVKVCIGNDINKAITDTLVDFVVSEGTNIRFEYDNETNYVGRQFLKGSTGEFLQVYCDNDGYIYSKDNSTVRLDKTNRQTFSDVSDWVYLIDVIAKPEGEDVTCYVVGKYPVNKNGVGTNGDQENNLGGYNADGDALQIKIMGNRATTSLEYNMRLIYDYKTNRLMAAWYPNGADITQNTITADAHFMISRKDDEDTKTFNLTSSDGKILTITQMVSALTISRDDYNSKKKNGVYFYWISLPYNCRVRDIYGIPGYGKKWAIQRYRGDKRAQYGFLYDIETFWANMKQNKTATMEANRGYVVRVQLTDNDFKEINGTSQVSLYFPSCNEQEIRLEKSATALTTNAPEMICNVVEVATGKSRKNWDSNWNIIGNPGMATMQITNRTSLSASDPNAQVEEGSNSLYYYYQWSFNSGSSTNNYTVKAVASQNIFKPLYSYMVQYGGDITWQPQIKTIDPSLLMRRIPEQDKKTTLIDLQLKDGEQIYDEPLVYDNTFVTLEEDAKTEFTLNKDIAKTTNNAPMIYTVFDEVNTAGKVLPTDTKEVPVVIRVPKVDSYDIENGLATQPEIFSICLGNEPDKKISLIDYKENKEYTLNNNAEYIVELQPGTYKNRFALRISERYDVATDIDNTQQEGDNTRIYSNGKDIYVEGLNQPSSATLFDLTGRTLFNATITNGQYIPAPQQGVYLLQINNNTHKIAIK